MSGGSNKAEFEYTLAHAKAAAAFAKYKFSGATTKDGLLKLVTAA